MFVRNTNGQFYLSPIRSIDIHLKNGYATPITQHGTLLVNNVNASCYSSVYHHTMGHIAMAPLRLLHRANKLFGLVNQNESQPNGIHWYPKVLNNFVHMFIPYSDTFISTTGKF